MNTLQETVRILIVLKKVLILNEKKYQIKSIQFLLKRTRFKCHLGYVAFHANLFNNFSKNQEIFNLRRKFIELFSNKISGRKF